MANYKVAYGSRDNIKAAISSGVIPAGSIILTNDSEEIFFYDLEKNLKHYEEKYKFTSKEEAQSWIDKYDCSGQILSVQENNKCNIYVVGYDNKLNLISDNNYLELQRDPTKDDINYNLFTHCINTDTGDAFILTSIKNNEAIWQKLLTNKSVQADWNVTDENDPSYIKNKPVGVVDATYVHKQTVASNQWLIKHDLGKFPSVSVVDSANSIVIGDVTYIDNNNVVVKFNGMFSGKAYLN